jgi:hypothetical protein
MTALRVHLLNSGIVCEVVVFVVDRPQVSPCWLQAAAASSDLVECRIIYEVQLYKVQRREISSHDVDGSSQADKQCRSDHDEPFGHTVHLTVAARLQ